jgi:hypothetical protein
MSFATPDMMRGTHSTGSQQALNMTMPSHSLFGAPYDNSMQARMALQASINNQKQILGVHANNLAAVQLGTASMLDGMYTHMPTMPLVASGIQINTTPASQSCDSQSMPLAENQNTPSKPTFADVNQLADKMFANKNTATDIHAHVHEALLDHRDNIKRVSTQNKALETGLLQHTDLMQQLHAQAQSLQKQIDAAKQSMGSQQGGLETHAQILDTIHDGMMNHTGALNSLNTKVKMSDYKLLETESRLSATLAQIQESLEEVEHAVVTHANILDDHETRLKQASTTNAQYTIVPDVMSMAPRRR